MPETETMEHVEAEAAQDSTTTNTNYLAMLRDQWGQFAIVMFSPLVVVLVLSAVTSIGVQARLGMGSGINAFFTVITAVLTGVAGAVIHDRWSKMRGEAVISARGRSAVRGLRLLLRHLNSFDEHHLHSVRKLHFDTDDPNRIDPLEGKIMEDVHFYLKQLRNHIINAIDEWTDFVPEAQSLVTGRDVVEITEREIAEKNRKLELVSMKLRSTEAEQELSDAERKLEVGELKRQRDELREDIAQLQRMVRDQRKSPEGIVVGPSATFSHGGLLTGIEFVKRGLSRQDIYGESELDDLHAQRPLVFRDGQLRQVDESTQENEGITEREEGDNSEQLGSK